MRFLKTLLFTFIPALMFLSSCANINSNILFKIPKGDKFVFDSIPLTPNEEYKLGTGDRFNFLFGTNDGEKIIFNQSGVSSSSGASRQTISQLAMRTSYLIRQDGLANLPLLGPIEISGKTVVEAENFLVELLSKNYLNPFVQISLTNQRVIIFPGKGDAKVVYLINTNTSLLEAIAMAGGINESGRSNSIKLMRKTTHGREIYKIDLSTISGLRSAEMIVQSNDYIYVDFKPRIASAFLNEITPWLSVLTTALLTYNIFNPQ
ncbi:MAG: polysaccharide biosynthesis/export family protein [Crocinitomicaceae bacterium]